MKNIVLIGMPGSGKTTIAKKLSEVLNMPLIDVDEYIVKKYRLSIKEMFEISEDYFRECETNCVKEVSLKSGVIISTGGGVIKKSENIEALKTNGIIFLLDRKLENIIKDIETSTRPLLKEGKEKIYTLYSEREMLYLNSAHQVIDNNGTIKQTLAQIMFYYHHTLNYQQVYLKQWQYVRDAKENWLPYYIFEIYHEQYVVGKLILRLGDFVDNEYSGHIGYTIYEQFRGHHYAYQACLAVREFIKFLGYNEVLITCSPDNVASKKTILKLNANYLETKKIPSELMKDYQIDETHKEIYLWLVD